MMAGRLGKEAAAALDGATFRVVAAPVEAPDPRERYRRGTHRAGFEGHVEIAVDEPFAAKAGAGRADDEDLGVRRRVVILDRAIAGFRDDKAAAHDHGANRHLAPHRRCAGLLERARHRGFSFFTVLAHARFLLPDASVSEAMTRDTDRPRRGTDRPAAARPRRATDKRGASAEPPPGDGQRRGSSKSPNKTIPRAFGDKPKFDKPMFDKPKRDGRGPAPSRPAPRPSLAKAAEPIATIAQPDRQRIAKLMARVGLCSRRDAEAWIVDGRVTLNGAILTSPAMDVGPKDTILVDGIPLPAAEKTRLFLFHKPRGLVTSDHDPEGRETVADHLAAHWPEGPRVVTIGRLDINTEGLLLLTNDGGLARMLELPATGWVRRYRVRAKGETDQGVLDRLRDGLVVDGVDYAGIEAKLDRIQGANCWLTMGLREGKNREIKRVLEHLGLEVNRLIRLSFGPFQLLDLPEGAVEEVKTRVLRDQLGATIAAEAGVDFADSDAPIVAPPVAPREGARRDAGLKPERRVDKRARRPAGPASEGRGARGTGVRNHDAANRDDTENPPIREKPVAGTRRHVATLRAEVAADLREGPRKRIERTDTTDRRDRVVKVERLVSAHAPEVEAPRARRGAGRFAPRDRESDGRGPRHASPSALAKRERIAKSGGERSFSDHAQEERGTRHAGGAGAKIRSGGPATRTRTAESSPRARSERPFSQGARERPARGPKADDRRDTRVGDEKPWRRERVAETGRPARVRRGESPRIGGNDAVGRNTGAKPTRAKAAGGKAADGKMTSDKTTSGKTKDRKTTDGKRARGDDRPARGGTGKPSKPRSPKR